MKTLYSTLGEAALKRLRETTRNAYTIQKELLLGLMQQNACTEYGRSYNFEHISSVREYQDRVPVTDYGNYDAYIERLLAGEERLLTEMPPVYFSISSGSTGESKYVPVTDADMEVHYQYAYGAIFGMVQEYYRDLPPEEVFGEIFQIGEFVKTYTSRGVMNGIRSSSLFQWLDRDGEFDASDYCVPKEVLFPDTLVDLIYVKVRFALANRDIRAIHGVFIHRVTGLLRYIEEQWDLLLKDMEQGTVDESIPLSREWKERVVRWLPPNPVRAGELRQLSRENLREQMIPKIWKNVKYILAIGGGSFSSYMGQLKQFAGEIPIHYFAYAASEGIFGVANGLNCPDQYILLPDAGFYEFLPEWDREVRPLTMEEVEKGKKYDLVFTNQSGLYRYDLMDVVEVVDFFGQSPVIRFCYRKNQVISIADEKTNMEQFEKAMRLFGKTAGMEIAGYGIQADYSLQPGRYLIYIEGTPTIPSMGGAAKAYSGENADLIMEECLQKSILGYAGCRRMNEISPAHMEFLPRGSFARYEEHLAATGRPMGQSKPLRILDTPEKCRFFAAQMEQKVWMTGMPGD